MLKNFNKPLNQKPQAQVNQLTFGAQKQATVTTAAKPAVGKGVSKHEQIELLTLLDKCSQIMKDDRLNMRNLIKDGAGQEVEEILMKHKKKQDISNLTLDLRKYLNKQKYKGGQTPTSNASNLAPTPNQRGSQQNLQQQQQQVDARQTRKGDQEQLYMQQQQQKNFTEAITMQQNKVQLDENQQQYVLEQQRIQQQQQLAMKMKQQQLFQQQQQQQLIEQQMKLQQGQNAQKMSPFRRPQQQQVQEMNNTHSPLKQSEQQAMYQDGQTDGGYEYTEEDEQSGMKLQQHSTQNQFVEVNENEESTLRKRLQEAHDVAAGVGTEEDHQQYGNEDDMEAQGEEEYQEQEISQCQYSQRQLTEPELNQQPFYNQSDRQVVVHESAMVTQNSQDLTHEQQYEYAQNVEDQDQKNLFQQQFQSMRRSNEEEEDQEMTYNDQEVEEAIMQEQQRIQQQEEEMERVKREREDFIQQAIERSQQSRFGNPMMSARDNQEEDLDASHQENQNQHEDEDSEVHEEFFDQINDLEDKEAILNKPNLLKLGSFQRGNSYQMADDPITPMNHPVHMDSGVQCAPIKHRMEEATNTYDDNLSAQKRYDESASAAKSQYSEVQVQNVNGDQRYHLELQNSRRNYTQESGSKYNQSAYSVNNQNSVRKSNNDAEMTTELIQHNFEMQMERAFFEQQHSKSSARGQQNNIFEDKSITSAYGQQLSADKQQFNSMNLFNCAVSAFAQDSMQQPYSAKGMQEYDSKVSYNNVDNYVRSATNQFTQPNEDEDDSCSINFANEKVELKYNVEEMMDSSVRDSHLQCAPQPTYVPKSEILKALVQEQPFQINPTTKLPPVVNSINYSTTLNVVHKTYDNYYPERIAIDISGNQNLFQKKATPSVPVNMFSTPSQSKYHSIGISQEQGNSNGKVYSSSILPPSILKSPAFRREYLRGTADPSANRDRVTSVISPSRIHERVDPSRDPIKRKYNNLFTSPQLMKQCKVDYDKENIGISNSPDSHQQFINSERELIEQETREFMKRSAEKSITRPYQVANSNVFSAWDQQELTSSRIRDSSVPKKSINFIRSPYSNNNLKESVMTTTTGMKQSIQLPQFMVNGSSYTSTEKSLFIAKFSLFNRTAQELFDAIFGDLIFQDKVTKLAFRNRLSSLYPVVSVMDIDNFFDFLDINQDQILDINEVGPVLMTMCDYKSKDNGKLIKVFNFLDIDRKGFVTRLETEHLISSSIQRKNYHNTAHNLSKQLFKEVDTQCKGYITYWELYSCKNSEPVKQLVDILTN